MSSAMQYLTMDNTTRIIIVLGLVTPFVINLLMELFVKNEKVKTTVQVILTILAVCCYIALLGYWFQNNMPKWFVLALLVLGGSALYIFGYIILAHLIRSIFHKDVVVQSAVLQKENETQKLSNCLRCGGVLSSAVCSSCGLNYSKGIKFLAKFKA